MNEDAQAITQQTAADGRGMQAAELSNAMVRIYKEQFGRGPTKSHAVFAGPEGDRGVRAAVGALGPKAAHPRSFT